MAKETGDDSKRVEKVIPKQSFLALVKSEQASASRAAAERGAFGQQVTKAVSEKGLDKWAFDVAVKLNKRDGGVAARHLRQLMIYCEYLEIGGQLDIEDEIDAKGDEGDPVEKVANGDGFDAGGAPKKLTTQEEKAALAAFKQNIAGLGKRAVARALEKFVATYPSAAEKAEAIAAKQNGTQSPASDAAGDFGYGTPPAGRA